MGVEVVTLGEIMGTLRFSGPFGVGTTVAPSLAGAEGNVAIGLARLGHQVSWVGTLGQDTFGNGILKTLRGEGVVVDHVSMRPEPTGLLVSRVVGPQSKSVDYHRSGSAGRLISKEQIDGALAEKPKFLHLTGITPALGDSANEAVEYAFEVAKRDGIKVVFDINFRSRLWSEVEATSVLSELAQRADIVIGGSEELRIVTGHDDPKTGMKVLSELGVREVVWKSSGLAKVLSDELVECENPIEVAVDPIGAGDAFVAGYLSGKISGFSTYDCLKRAHAMGRIIVGLHGDWEGLPTLADLQRHEIYAGQEIHDGGSVIR